MYPLFETICLKDGVVQNLYWHQRRYENSLQNFYSKSVIKNLQEEINVPEEVKTGIYKLRVFYNDADTKYEFEKYVTKKIKNLKLAQADDIDYELKYSDRSQLNNLVNLRGNCDDILISQNGMITDTAYANIVFTDGAKWFTPSTPLLRGTCRARLLDEKAIESVDISIKDLKQFIGFNLINAMNDLEKNDFIKIDNIIF